MHPGHILAGVTLAALAVSAQNPTPGSVLDLNASYHFGSYACEVDSPSGDVLLARESGSLDLTANGLFSGSIDVVEWTTGGSTTNSETFSGGYFVFTEGAIELDFDLANPGNDVAVLYCNADASVWHLGRQDLDPWASSLLAVQKSTGQSDASLSGAYNVYTQYLEFNGTGLQTRSEQGIVTFDGLGGGSFVGTEVVIAPNGATTTSPVNTSAPYSVAADGAILVGGNPGAISPNGELFYFTVGGTGSSRVGMVIGVRVGPSYDHALITGRYSLHGLGVDLVGPAGTVPNCVSDWGELELAAVSANAGVWSGDGQTVDSNPGGVTPGPFSASGSTSLATDGVLTMSEPAGPVFELAFSESGDFGVGKVFEGYANMFFVMRQCPVSESYGAATPGTGGVAPLLSMQGFPTLGNATWAWELYDALGGTAAMLAITDGPLPGVPALGGLIHVDPTLLLVAPAALLSGAPGQAGAGVAAWTLPIPNNPVFAYTAWYSQAFVLDPGAPADLSMTPGLLTTICPF